MGLGNFVELLYNNATTVDYSNWRGQITALISEGTQDSRRAAIVFLKHYTFLELRLQGCFDSHYL